MNGLSDLIGGTVHWKMIFGLPLLICLKMK